MSIPPKLSRKLHEVFGNEGADVMADWMNHQDEGNAEVRADMAEFRQETRIEFAELREEMRVGFAEMTATMEKRFAAVDVKFAMIDARFAATDAKIDAFDGKLAQRNFELMKWAFGFWLASLTMLAGVLAVFLRR
jgi:hypothetical protein